MQRALVRVANAALTGNDAEHIDFPVAGRIVGIQIAASLNSIVDNTNTEIQVSTQPVFSDASSTAVPVLATVRLYANFATSGLNEASHNFFVPCDEQIKPGQTVFLNSNGGGTGDWSATVVLHMR